MIKMRVWWSLSFLVIKTGSLFYSALDSGSNMYIYNANVFRFNTSFNTEGRNNEI